MSRAARLHALMMRLQGAPLAISQRGLEAVRAQLERGAEAFPSVAPSTPADTVTSDGVAVISVNGVLLAHADEIDEMFGFKGYSTVEASIAKALADRSVNGVLLSINSPGGECAGCFELAEKIAAWDGVKPIHAAATPMAASAAYALASASGRVTVSRAGDVGSVGVVQPHVDLSGFDQKLGVKWSYVYAGAKKLDGDPHGPLSDSARADRQAEVDRLYAMFVKSVADNRGLAQRDVRDTEAGMFMGDAAVKVGLADQVGTLDDALASLRAEIKRRGAMSFQKNVASKLAMIAALAVTAESDESTILAGIDKTLELAQASEKRVHEIEKALGERDAQLAALGEENSKLQAAAVKAGADHAIELAKTRLVEAGFAPMDKEVEEDARALFVLGKAELAKRTLDRGLDVAKAKKAALSDPKARVQREEKPEGSPESKQAVLEKAKANAAALAEAGKSKRSAAK